MDKNSWETKINPIKIGQKYAYKCNLRNTESPSSLVKAVRVRLPWLHLNPYRTHKINNLKTDRNSIQMRI